MIDSQTGSAWFGDLPAAPAAFITAVALVAAVGLGVQARLAHSSPSADEIAARNFAFGALEDVTAPPPAPGHRMIGTATDHAFVAEDVKAGRSHLGEIAIYDDAGESAEVTVVSAGLSLAVRIGPAPISLVLPIDGKGVIVRSRSTDPWAKVAATITAGSAVIPLPIIAAAHQEVARIK